MKRIRVILLFLLLGAIVNVAVAWGFAATYLRIWDVVSRSQLRASASGDSWQFTRTELNGVILLNGVPSGRILVGSGYEKEAAPDQIPSWSRMIAPPLPRPGFNPEQVVPGFTWEVIYISEVATGWPYLSMYCRHEMEYPSQKMAVKYGIVITRKLTHPVRYTSLPLRILWTGFLLNSALFAMAIWLICWATVQVRRVFRLERGCCINCGYDLQGGELQSTDSVSCPECNCTSPFCPVREYYFGRFLIRAVLINSLPVPITAALCLTVLRVFHLDHDSNEILYSTLAAMPYVAAIIAVSHALILGFRHSDSSRQLRRLAYGGILFLLTGLINYLQIILYVLIYIAVGLY